MVKKVRVWDLPTRLFHWALVACLVGLIVTANVGGEAMKWHFRFGYTVLALVAFRVMWGFVGGYWSRFANFVVSPATVIRYAKGEQSAAQQVGHNPMGAYSVLGLLVLLGIQAGAGLMADDEIMWAGPLAAKVPATWVRFATLCHTEISKVVLMVLVLLHISAILWYRFRKNEDLVRPMLSGDKELAVEVPESQDAMGTRFLALVLLGVSGLLVYALVTWAGG